MSLLPKCPSATPVRLSSMIGTCHLNNNYECFCKMQSMVYILGRDWRTGFSHSVRKRQDAEGGSGSVPTPGLCTVPPRALWDFWNSKHGRMGRGPPTPRLSTYVPEGRSSPVQMQIARQLWLLRPISPCFGKNGTPFPTHVHAPGFSLLMVSSFLPNRGMAYWSSCMPVACKER